MTDGRVMIPCDLCGDYECGGCTPSGEPTPEVSMEELDALFASAQPSGSAG